ncbi:SET domain-containing protein [Paenibacillus polysaccharolyticus]|uniref:SET domain-containing protein n=1 Tax=Paenibacillus polysaccharolyticus TaxID=582692 RepID=UPI00203BB09D|nr:SET domain-containing protein [Paenibacillus polysaccharolyticus]MCM3132345.1 SET domain-containing protein [Paenibacillus polysaccharolyticus]
MIEVKQSKLGDGGEFNRGVFATVDIAKGQLIHQAPVVPYPNEDHEHIEKTILEDYVFEYGANHTAILLGYGSLINHSYEPNATYDINFENHTFDFYAYKDIKAGEEILINYNGEEDNMDPLWFLDDYEERMREMQDKEEQEAEPTQESEKNNA